MTVFGAQLSLGSYPCNSFRLSYSFELIVVKAFSNPQIREELFIRYSVFSGIPFFIYLFRWLSIRNSSNSPRIVCEQRNIFKRLIPMLRIYTKKYFLYLSRGNFIISPYSVNRFKRISCQYRNTKTFWIVHFVFLHPPPPILKCQYKFDSFKFVWGLSLLTRRG